MNPDATRSRILRRAIAVTIAVVSIAAASLAAPAVDSEETAVIGILHPMAPIGNIDCCH